MNDLPVGRSVDETLRLVQAFQVQCLLLYYMWKPLMVCTHPTFGNLNFPIIEIFRLLQYTDKHGEVCPAGWKPGSDTIIPDPKEKMKYFKEHGDL